ncbi:MAG: hypothetical protein ABR576_15650 [Thermoanaerobaculia bacterium]
MSFPARPGWPRAASLAAGVFLLAAVVSTWPQVRHVRDGLTDIWDAKFTAWVMHWDYAQTFRDPLRLFHANIFHPARYALAFSENLYGAAVFGFPLYAAGVSTLAAYNVSFLLGMALSGMGAWALARAVTGDGPAALLAGLIFAFNPWRLAQIPHIQFQWAVFLPLFLLFLLRYLEDGRRRDALFFALFFAWNALANLHYALFGGMLALLVLAYWRLARPGESRRVRAGLLWLGAACVAVSPFLWPYFRVAQLYGTRRSAGEMKFFSGRLLDFLTAGAENKLYAPLTQKWGKPEGDFFFGLVPLALAVYAIVAFARARKPQRAERPALSPGRLRLVRLFDAVTVLLVGLWIAATAVPGLRLGPLKLGDPGRILVFASVALVVRLLVAFPGRSRFRDLSDFMSRQRLGTYPFLFVLVFVLGLLITLGANTPFYRFLFQSLGPVMRGIRVPARGIVLVHLAVALLAAWGLSLLARRRPGRLRSAAWIAGGLLLTGFEYRAFPVPVHPVEERAAPVYGWMATLPAGTPIVEMPFGTDYDVEYEFRSTAHWQPLLNGYSGAGPAHYHELFGLMNEIPIPDRALEKARELGAEILVLHPHPGAAAQARPEAVKAVFRWTAAGRLEALAAFPHGDATDYVFRFAGGKRFDAHVPVEMRHKAAAEVESLRETHGRLSPPFGVIEFPREGATVDVGSWGFGWALDESGIAEVRVSAPGAPAAAGVLGGDFPGVSQIFPGYPGSAKPGYGFRIPALPPGAHTLTATIVAHDGGEIRLQRRVRIR